MARFLLAMLLSLSTGACTQLGSTGQALSAEDRGAGIFRKYCTLCHGEKGDGKGPAAHLHHPSPANLRMSRRSDEYKKKIIREGGAAVGRSRSMPPWRAELSDQDILDLVAYLRSLNVQRP
jgi:mono/diheme cytochrome c family protein